MAFLPHSAGTSVEHSELVQVPIGNSIVLSVGEVVSTSITGGDIGYLENGVAAAPILGVVVGFANAAGVPLAPDAYVAGTATSSDVQTATAASNNQTTFAKYAIVEVSRDAKFSAPVSGTLGTTANSPTATDRRFGGWINVNSAGSAYGELLESSFLRSRTAGTVQNFYCWGVDPADTTRYIVSIACSERTMEQK